ncbi:protein ECT2-like isoform X2 [Gordionus sp. m RMFG-2023]|uniref:protein ECT2-like isoform X2 n=1 Tax=Gordionus sp. m RMFG-2023 TaxID=3053472 RepID=UPI0031FCA4D6
MTYYENNQVNVLRNQSSPCAHQKFHIFLLGTELHNDTKLLRTIKNLGLSVGLLDTQDFGDNVLVGLVKNTGDGRGIGGGVPNYNTPMGKRFPPSAFDALAQKRAIPAFNDQQLGPLNPNFLLGDHKSTGDNIGVLMETSHNNINLKQVDMSPASLSNYDIANNKSIGSGKSSLKGFRRFSTSRLPPVFQHFLANPNSNLNPTNNINLSNDYNFNNLRASSLDYSLPRSKTVEEEMSENLLGKRLCDENLNDVKHIRDISHMDDQVGITNDIALQGFYSSISNVDIKALRTSGQAEDNNTVCRSYDFDRNNPFYVVPDFCGNFFDKLLREKFGRRLIAPPFIYHVSRLLPITTEIPEVRHPIFCLSMRGLNLCFSQFTDTLKLTNLVCISQYMGATVRKKFNSAKVTHLIALTAQGDKYRAASNLGKPIMSQDWIIYCWERRFDLDFVPTKEEIITRFKLKPFVGCNLSFIGFSNEEKLHMEDQAIANGAKILDCEDPKTTHIVVDEQNVKTENLNINACDRNNLLIVKAEWFWVSIQLDFCADEKLYYFLTQNQDKFLNGSLCNTPSSNSTTSILNSNNGPNNCNNNMLEISTNISLANKLLRERSYSTSILDSSGDNSLLLQGLGAINESPVVLSSDLSSILNYNQCHSARQMTAVEILNTEKNYITCLELIKNVYHKPLEENKPNLNTLLSLTLNPNNLNNNFSNMQDDISDHSIHYNSGNPSSVVSASKPLLDPTEIKAIFGNLPPIYEVHKRMLVDLSRLLRNYTEESCIGNVILAHVDGMIKAYPPFINFFHDSKNTLKFCDQTKPKFHAFLKICQNKVECGRQSLEDLLIRPVQRLPSLILLLSDLLKHTPQHSDDRVALDEAINAVKNVLDQINEGKRKTETQLHMFEIVNDIENCPPNLLSSQRTFIFKAFVQGLTNEPSVKGRHLAIFLFNDCLEICKRRNAPISLNKLTNLNFLTSSSLNHPSAATNLNNSHYPVSKSNPNMLTSNVSKNILNPSNLNDPTAIKHNPLPLPFNSCSNNQCADSGIKMDIQSKTNQFISIPNNINDTNRSNKITKITSTLSNASSLTSSLGPVAKSGVKNYKHVELLHLSHVKIIGDIVDNEEFMNSFAIICSHNSNQYTREGRLLLFSVEDEEPLKKPYILEALHKNTVNTLCLSDGRSILHPIHPDQINISSPIAGTNVNGTISKAFRNAKKLLSRKMSRAFSFNKSTPFKLKRTVSTISTLATSPALCSNLDSENNCETFDPIPFNHHKQEQTCNELLVSNSIINNGYCAPMYHHQDIKIRSKTNLISMSPSFPLPNLMHMQHPSFSIDTQHFRNEDDEIIRKKNGNSSNKLTPRYLSLVPSRNFSFASLTATPFKQSHPKSDDQMIEKIVKNYHKIDTAFDCDRDVTLIHKL